MSGLSGPAGDVGGEVLQVSLLKGLDSGGRALMVVAPAAGQPIHQVKVHLNAELSLDREDEGEFVGHVSRQGVHVRRADADGGAVAKSVVVQPPDVGADDDGIVCVCVPDRLPESVAQAIRDRPVVNLGAKVSTGDDEYHAVRVDFGGHGLGGFVCDGASLSSRATICPQSALG